MSGTATDPDGEARETAVRLLARREHSKMELRRKLATRGVDAECIDRVLDRLSQQGLQSERRFAEGFARQRAERGHGPVRIAAELRERGVDPALVAEALDSLEVDFAERARAVYRRKYGEEPGTPLEYRERARRFQAMRRRGFDVEHIRDLIGD
ncbi:MAG: regulatory protein RecX [Wenzhouxiangellaceae bacterium]